MDNYILTGAKLVLPDRISEGQYLLVQNRKISHCSNLPSNTSDFTLIDCTGLYAVPGFFEIHFHGCGPYSITDPEPDTLEKISEMMAQHGINRFLLGMMWDENALAHCVHQLEKNPQLEKSIKGFYLEGPFINPQKRGGILPETIFEPDLNLLKRIISISGNRIRAMTLAPEIPGISEIMESLHQNGVRICFGHSDATSDGIPSYELFRPLGITHLFNAMSSLTHKHPGLASLPFMDKNIYFELIADTVHVHPDILKIAVKNLNLERMILISDGVVSAGEKDGYYTYAGQEVISGPDGVRYKETGILVGSKDLLDEGIRKLRSLTGLEINKLINTVTLNPSTFLGLSENRGSLAEGNDADILLLDNNLNLVKNLWI